MTEPLRAWMQREGYEHAREVNGRVVAVTPLTFGRARIIIGDRRSIFDGW